MALLDIFRGAVSHCCRNLALHGLAGRSVKTTGMMGREDLLDGGISGIDGH